MGFSAMSDDAGGNAEVGGIKSEDALNVGKHEGIGKFRQFRRRRGRVRSGRRRCCRDGTVGCDGEERFGSDDAAHGMTDQDRANGGLNSGGGCDGRDFEVDDDILKPVV